MREACVRNRSIQNEHIAIGFCFLHEPKRRGSSVPTQHLSLMSSSSTAENRLFVLSMTKPPLFEHVLLSCCWYSSIQRRSRLPARCLGMKKSLSEDCFSLSKDVIYQKDLDVYIFVVFLQLLKFSDRLGLFTAYSFNFHCFCCNTNVRLNLL